MPTSQPLTEIKDRNTPNIAFTVIPLKSNEILSSLYTSDLPVSEVPLS